jgi:hypothetical protein
MANEQTRGLTDYATTQNNDAGSDMKGRARELVDNAKERASERIESRFTETKSRAAETLSGVASGLLTSSETLRDQNGPASRAFERAAEGVDRFAQYLQDTDVDDVIDQVHEFARRQPAAFIGGAFALGFIASRFIKATTPNSRRLPAASDYGRGYDSSYDTSRSYESGTRYTGDVEERSSTSRGGGYGNTGDVSGSLGYGAGLSTTGGGATGGGYSTGSTLRNTDDLGDGMPGLGGAGTTGASRTGNTAGGSTSGDTSTNRSGTTGGNTGNRGGSTGGSNAGSR